MMSNALHEEEVASLWREIEALSQSFYDRVFQVSRQFWETKPSGEKLHDWLKERVWSEREGAKMHAYVVVKMADVLDPDSLIFLAEQAADEARHYRLVARCLAARGLSIDGYEPSTRWRGIFQEDYDAADQRDPVLLFSILHMGGEGPASATAKAAMDALKGTLDDDIARAYEMIYPDESNHWRAGREALQRYATTVAALERSRNALREKAEHLFSGYKRFVLTPSVSNPQE
jgi:hypothetical protein